MKFREFREFDSYVRKINDPGLEMEDEITNEGEISSNDGTKSPEF